MTMTSSYLLLLLRTEAEVRELLGKPAATKLPWNFDEAFEALLDQIEPIPDVDDSEKMKRCRDPYLKSESYRGDE